MGASIIFQSQRISPLAYSQKADNTRALQSNEIRNKRITQRISSGDTGEPEDLPGAAVFFSQ